LLHSVPVFNWFYDGQSSTPLSPNAPVLSCPVWPSKAIATSKQLVGLDTLPKPTTEPLPKAKHYLKIADHAGRSVFWGAMDAAADRGLETLFGHLSPPYVIGGLAAGFLLGPHSIRHARKAFQSLRAMFNNV
jgi:hypothetical protein